MNLERLLELVFNNPENISIEYSNINGKEKLVVNGEELIEDDSEIKERIENYKANIKKLDDSLFEKVLDEAEKRNFNLLEMNNGLELEHYTVEDEFYANTVIDVMTELIQEVIEEEINKLADIYDQFSR